MNVRRNTDYSELFAMLDQAMLPELPEMKLYFMIGSCVGSRQEKGAAVAAAEYLQAKYPDAKGFSARNIRRMRDFYLAYADDSVTLTLAEKIGWAKNVVILESGLTQDERVRYIRAVHQLGWSKLVLASMIAERAHEQIILDNEPETCYTDSTHTVEERHDESAICLPREYMNTIAGSLDIDGLFKLTPADLTPN